MKKFNVYFIIVPIIFVVALSCKKEVTEPNPDQLDLHFSLTPVSVYGGSDGVIDLTVTGGSEPLQYQWSNGETSEDISNLTIGIYSVIVTDLDNKTKTGSANITQPPGLIVFSKNEIEIYVINSDGTGLQQLTHHSGNHSGPAWSPDGKKIAYYDQITNTTASEYIMDAEGNNVQGLTFDMNVIDSPPCWTPEGKILFARSYPLVNSLNEIWMINSDGSDLHRITEVGGIPHCSHDGSKIAYSESSDGDGEIWIMNIDGSNKNKITHNHSQDWLPAWSPIADQIVFQSDRDGNHEIYVMNADGSNVQRLTNNSFYDGYPRWSSDGSEIIFESTRSGGYEIYKMDVSGSNQVRLTFTNGSAFQPDWKP